MYELDILDVGMDKILVYILQNGIMDGLVWHIQSRIDRISSIHHFDIAMTSKVANRDCWYFLTQEELDCYVRKRAEIQVLEMKEHWHSINPICID